MSLFVYIFTELLIICYKCCEPPSVTVGVRVIESQMMTIHPIRNLFSRFLQTGFCRCFLLTCSVSSAMDAHLEFGHKAAELLVPVVECGCGRDDEERAPDVVSLRDTEYKSKCELPATGRPGGTFHASSCH